MLVACGGDGTLNEVVSGMAGSDVPLLVIPGGTSNVLAREIGLPRDLPACAALLRRGAIRRISLGQAGDRRFVLMAGIGVDAGIVAASNSRLNVTWVRGHSGWPAFNSLRSTTSYRSISS